MKRREFITLLGGAARVAAGGARAAGRADAAHRRAPARSRGRCEFQARVGAFLQGLALLGWTIGRNVRIDTRWATANAADIRRHAAELVALAPDVILAPGGTTVGPLLQATRTVPIVFPVARRSGRRRLRRQPGAAGRQRHRFHEFRIQHGREMAGAAQADRAGRDASGGPSGYHRRLRNQPVCRHPGRGAVAQGGGEPGQHARRRRDRARRRGLRALSEWRSDRDGGRGRAASSRSDHHAGGPAQAARGLSRTYLRRRWRPDLLWA